MTLQDAKNQVARIYKYSNWNQMELDLKKELLQDWVISRLHEAAGLYANSVNKELREEVERLKDCLQKILAVKDLWYPHYKHVKPEHKGEYQALHTMFLNIKKALTTP